LFGDSILYFEGLFGDGILYFEGLFGDCILYFEGFFGDCILKVCLVVEFWRFVSMYFYISTVSLVRRST